MNKAVSLLVAGALSLAPALYAQQDDATHKKGQGHQQADRASQETLTGCLTEEQGSFKLATGSGDQVDVTGPAALTKHKNHTVKLTGTTSNEGGKRMMTVTKIEHVSPSCTK